MAAFLTGALTRKIVEREKQSIAHTLGCLLVKQWYNLIHEFKRIGSGNAAAKMIAL
jgi:hypothetical protein